MFTKERESDLFDYVLPYKNPNSNGSTILKHLKQTKTGDINEITVRHNLDAAIPILNNIDVADLINKNTEKLLLARASKQKGLLQEESLDEDTSAVDDNSEPTRFIPIKDFYPKNLKDQLGILIIQNFPNLKKMAIEKVLLKLTKAKFYWSLFEYEFLDNQLVFIKFNKVLDANAFYNLYNTKLSEILNSEKVHLISDLALSKYCKQDDKDEDKDEKSGDKDTTTDIPASTLLSVSQLLKSKRSDIINIEDSTEVSEYYGNYKVDSAELVDVPNHMKVAIIKDIIKFRSSVLIREKQNRLKDLETERHNTILRLKKFSEDIKEANDEMITESGKNYNSNNEASDPFEDLNDEEYEKLLNDEVKAKLESEYKKTSLQMERIESTELGVLKTKLNDLKDYENTLIDNKIKFIDDLRDITNEQNSTLPSIVFLHQKDHSQYIKLRSQKRTIEETRDADDRRNEEEHNNRKKSDIIKTSLSLPQTHLKPKILAINIQEFLVDQTSSMNAKIEELVEEYLGIKDEYLVNNIKQNLSANNLSAKEQLIADLVEVLDDDAENLISDLFNYIKEL